MTEDKFDRKISIVDGAIVVGPQRITRRFTTFVPPPETSEKSRDPSSVYSRESLSGRRFSTDETPVPIPVNTTADDLIFLGTLSRSSMSEVVLVKRQDTKEVIAAKTFDVNSWRSEYLCHAELRVLQCVSSPWVVAFLGYIQDLSEDFILLEYMPYGNLLELANANALTESQLKFYAAEMFMAVDSLHQNGIMHRNVQLSNFMLHLSGHLRIIGFGLSYQFNQDRMKPKKRFLGRQLSKPKLSRCTNPVYASPDKESTEPEIGGPSSEAVNENSSFYMPPEMFQLVMPSAKFSLLKLTKETLGYSYLCDYWAVGVAVYRLLFDQYPFVADGKGLVPDKVMNYRRTLSYPSTSKSQTGVKLVTSLLKKESKRLGRYRGFFEVQEHEFFKSLHWDRLGHGQVSVPITGDEFHRGYMDPNGSVLRVTSISRSSTPQTSRSLDHVAVEATKIDVDHLVGGTAAGRAFIPVEEDVHEPINMASRNSMTMKLHADPALYRGNDTLSDSAMDPVLMATMQLQAQSPSHSQSQSQGEEPKHSVWQMISKWFGSMSTSSAMENTPNPSPK